jgi:hypothetical protein
MKQENFFFNCSKGYVDGLDPSLFAEISGVISQLPKRQTQEEINNDLFWLLTDKSWAFDTMAGVTDYSPEGLEVKRASKESLKGRNNRSLCLTSTTLAASWHSDFAKAVGSGLVQLEAQFGKVESMFKDFCGFRIAYYERRLVLGIEIVLSEPSAYFAHRKNAVGGMAYFEIAKNTLPAIGLECPIWLIGMKD